MDNIKPEMRSSFTNESKKKSVSILNEDTKASTDISEAKF